MLTAVIKVNIFDPAPCSILPVRVAYKGDPVESEGEYEYQYNIEAFETGHILPKDTRYQQNESDNRVVHYYNPQRQLAREA